MRTWIILNFGKKRINCDGTHFFWPNTRMFTIPRGYSWKPPPHYTSHSQRGQLLAMQSALGKNTDSHVNAKGAGGFGINIM